MKTITFYSYKGGVGRTLALANIAKRLSEFGKKVCLLDFDLEAPDLHNKFKGNIKNITKGIVDYIDFFNKNNTLPKSISEYVTPIKFNNLNQTDIDLIAAGNIFSQKYWTKLFSIDWIKLFYNKNSQGIALFIDLKEKIKTQLNPDFLLVDSRTGISEISGITITLLADEVVLLAANNNENIDGTKLIIKTLIRPENNVFGKIPKINFVLCRIPYFQKPEEKPKEFSAINKAVLNINSFLSKSHTSFRINQTFVIHSYPELELEEKFLMGYEFEKEQKRDDIPISTDYLKLFEELTKDVLFEDEKKRFNIFKKAELLFKEANNENDSLKKIDTLKEVLQLNPKFDEAYYQLAIVYYTIKNFEKAISYVNSALELNVKNLNYLYLKAYILSISNKENEAIELLNSILEIDKKYYGALGSLGSIYEKKGDYLTALKYFNQIVEFYPDYYSGYNSVGNTLKFMEKYDEAFKYVYKALELNPKDPISNSTLAEIYAHLGNDNEFFKNLELSLSFGMKSEDLERTLSEDNAYKKYIQNNRFIELINKYNLSIDLSKYIKK